MLTCVYISVVFELLCPNPKGLLGPIVYIDLTNLDEEPARDRLLAGVEHDQAKPTTPPSFPEAEPRTVKDRPTYPGALPPIWNIPHLRIPNFTRREELLDHPHTILVRNNLESFRRR